MSKRNFPNPNMVISCGVIIIYISNLYIISLITFESHNDMKSTCYEKDGVYIECIKYFLDIVGIPRI